MRRRKQAQPTAPADGAPSPPRLRLLRPDLPTLSDVAPALAGVLDSGCLSNSGEYVRRLEDEASRYLGTHVVAVSSGTTGLILALQAVGLRPGLGVAMPSFTFAAAAQAVLFAGGFPRFVDVGDDLLIAPADLARVLDTAPDVDVVMPVHCYGIPCRISEIEDVVDRASRRRRRRIAVVYDAAHAFGAAIGDVRVGSNGDAEVFSLSGTKVFTSAEGGLVTSRDARLIDRIRSARNYGFAGDYDALLPGLNGKMSELHAIIGVSSLASLDGRLDIRRRRAGEYAAAIHARTSFKVLGHELGVEPTHALFTVITPHDPALLRDDVLTCLDRRGIETRTYFDPPLHVQQMFHSYRDGSLPNTVRLAPRVINVPFFTSITGEQMDRVVAALRDAETP